MKYFFLYILVIFSLFSCKRENLDPDYPFTVVVKTYDDSIAVNNVLVEVSTPVVGNTVEMFGYTNEDGKINFEYDLDAVLLVRATRGNPITYMGCADIRLEPDKNVVKYIYLKPYVPSEGCTYSP